MNRGRWTLTALCLATYMLLLDITIVQVALPAIGREFHEGLTGLQWAVDAYVLPLAALVVSLGTLADWWGRRTVFLTGVVGFTLASVACGAAQSALGLDVSRAVQGLAGAAMFATTLALIGQEFQGAARGRAIVIWGSTVGAAVASGPLVGGILTDLVSWRWIFFVNAPLGVVTFFMTLRYVGEGRDTTRRPLDVPGVLALSGGLALLTAGLLRGTAENWHGSGPRASIAAGVVLLLAFAALQRRDGAMIDRTLYRSRPFVGVTIATLGLGAGVFAMMLFLNVFLQNALDASPLQAGLELLPMSLPVLIVPIAARRAGLPVVSGRTIGVGLVLAGAGLLLMTRAGADRSWATLLPGLVVAGVGVGLANVAIAATALAVVPPTRTGLASGVSNACRVAGITVGIAALGAVMRVGISADLGSVPGKDGIVSLVSAGQLHLAERATARPGTIVTAFDQGWHATLVAGAVTVLTGAVAAFALVGRPALGMAHAPAMTAPEGSPA